ncbi:hypothetical protein [Francisella frigiditurris]|uniref:Uncharacterized protein n=1 Tax=Francisella frigiditurris TaxID=1542390 RepID=A0A1J0KS52_9GAMM|nr:hypothetical protein [Francisella frigiditurris]APC96535.1 hypothetical protein KX01_1402 [Francisella frigiditurris]
MKKILLVMSVCLSLIVPVVSFAKTSDIEQASEQLTTKNKKSAYVSATESHSANTINENRHTAVNYKRY